MKALFSEGPNQTVVFEGIVPEDYVVPTGFWAKPYDEFTTNPAGPSGGLMPAEWAAARVWDDALGAPREYTELEKLERARKAKEDELLRIFADRNRARFPATPGEPQDASLWRFLGVYATNQNDARIVAFKTDKNTLDARLASLSKLGSGGNNPPLTLEEIAKIVW